MPEPEPDLTFGGKPLHLPSFCGDQSLLDKEVKLQPPELSMYLAGLYPETLAAIAKVVINGREFFPE